MSKDTDLHNTVNKVNLEEYIESYIHQLKSTHSSYSHTEHL